VAMDIIQWDNKSERDRIEKIKDMDKEFIFNTNKGIDAQIDHENLFLIINSSIKRKTPTKNKEKFTPKKYRR